jgi:hypothetical protein
VLGYLMVFEILMDIRVLQSLLSDVDYISIRSADHKLRSIYHSEIEMKTFYSYLTGCQIQIPPIVQNVNTNFECSTRTSGGGHYSALPFESKRYMP